MQHLRWRKSADRYLEKVSHRGLQKSLFLFPAILGSHRAYANIVKSLSKTADIFAVRYPPLRTMKQADAMQALGTFCAECIRSVAASDTYLIGWSMGGLVAYECGAKMHAAGTPATIITVDPAPAVSSVDLSGPDSQALWEEFLVFRFGVRTKDQIVRDGSFWRHSIPTRFRVLQEAFPPDKGVAGAGDLRTAFRHLHHSYARLRNYSPSIYSGNFHTLISDEWIKSAHPAWLEAHTSLKNFTRVSGNHLTAILNFCVPPITQIVGAEETVVTSGASGLASCN
jgi:thioesterase domain-containing protein